MCNSDGWQEASTTSTDVVEVDQVLPTGGLILGSALVSRGDETMLALLLRQVPLFAKATLCRGEFLCDVSLYIHSDR